MISDNDHPDTPAARPPRQAPVPPPHHHDRVGDILRRVREHRGEDLDSISERLRIKPEFLVALEDSRYDRLPADAYVIGFLRSYADYLDLDGRAAIDQYRREMAGRRRKPQLTMPQPMPEGRAPSAVLLAGAALAALLVYGVWYGLSTPDAVAESKPIILPETTSVAAAPSVEIPSTTAESIVLQTASPPETTLLPTPDSSAPDATVAAKEPQPENATEKTPSDKNEKKTEPATVMKPQTFGGPEDSRVKVRADKDSWIMITDSKGVTVFDRTLKAGEVYNVPTGRNLNMTTSSPSNVSLLIDGAAMPKLSARTRVVRDVPLDPVKLKSRLTAPSPSQPVSTPVEKDEDTASD